MCAHFVGMEWYFHSSWVGRWWCSVTVAEEWVNLAHAGQNNSSRSHQCTFIRFQGKHGTTHPLMRKNRSNTFSTVPNRSSRHTLQCVYDITIFQVAATAAVFIAGQVPKIIMKPLCSAAYSGFTLPLNVMPISGLALLVLFK